ncbi:MAG: AhpC/TSA family protein [Proteobacteria bacterium]|nr:AhpC/TSA family protein [Pseudomonadota bacterium]
MSLKDKLDEIRAKGHQDVAVKAAVESVVGTLRQAESAANALKVGDPMPAFVLPNAEGRLIASDELLTRGPLVVSFFRGDWCPYCRTMLQTYEASLPAIAGAGGQLVAISPDTSSLPSVTKHKFGLHFEVLSDPDSAVTLQFGVMFRAPEAYRDLLKSRGIDLADRHGNEGWFIPIPATFVVDQTGTIRYAFTDIDFTYRAEPDAIVAALRALRGRK